MATPQYAILRFSKYKGPEIGNIEAHNERTKEKYNSNPDIDRSRSHLNFHLISPEGHYRALAEGQIKAAGCRTRTDSVRLVEVLVTATPEFFRGKNLDAVKAYFQEALRFMQAHQGRETILSAVIHMDEKTPHMHLSFVPLTQDGRLSAKEIVGNKKKLTQWQDDFWAHMVAKYPDLERGASATLTGRNHIPPRLFKQMEHLTREKAELERLLTGITPFNAKSRGEAIAGLLDRYIPNVTKMQAQLNRYQVAFTETATENSRLTKRNQQLSEQLGAATESSALKQLQELKLKKDYEEAAAILERIPPDVLAAYRRMSHRTEAQHKERG